MSLNKLAKLLPDVFKKDEASNIGKLLLIFEDQIDHVRALLEKTATWRDIENAKGSTLDELGANVGQFRGKSPDEVYRVLIRGKVARNCSDGTIDKMLHALATSLNCPPSEIQIVAANETEDEKEAAAIIIKKAPLTYLNKSGLSVSQFLQIAESISSGGVRMAYVNLEGTFSFASGKTIEESDEGFADIDETAGGTLGGVFMPDDDYKLPL
ncbi:hypothetical protein [Enterococcus wangshanyuanii]|uniref:DUF2612 domain-containing protein n=1 Tax=Enterococcus wangshanyuanii TaxID=2005703 RepID=A0ABQ1PIR7_9ENTE|nr:hypothetical protein [Enterococcus wangshanyuanii]GGC97939.1 hypothetical protein GCM10011573_29350 [Enterococcus wangshanyuanii]